MNGGANKHALLDPILPFPLFLTHLHCLSPWSQWHFACFQDFTRYEKFLVIPEVIMRCRLRIFFPQSISACVSVLTKVSLIKHRFAYRINLKSMEMSYYWYLLQYTKKSQGPSSIGNIWFISGCREPFLDHVCVSLCVRECVGAWVCGQDCKLK